ncbi:MAG: hypothetical protein ACOCX2_14840 [Armatimonadota bacterium]
MKYRKQMNLREIVLYLIISGLALAAYAVLFKDVMPTLVRMILPPLVMAGLAYYVAWRTGRVWFAVGMSWASLFSFALMLLCVAAVARLTGADILDGLIAPEGGDEMTLADDVRVILTGVATVPLQFLAALIATRRRSNDLSQPAEP